MTNLLHSRLALPLMYVSILIILRLFIRYPLNTRMDAISKTVAGNSPIPHSPFSEREHLQCMSQISPIVVGMSKITSLLKATDALTNYSGGRMRRRFKPNADDDGKVIQRRHQLRAVEHKGGTINTRVGLGRGWENFGQGPTVDSPRRKFKV